MRGRWNGVGDGEFRIGIEMVWRFGLCGIFVQLCFE